MGTTKDDGKEKPAISEVLQNRNPTGGRRLHSLIFWMCLETTRWSFFLKPREKNSNEAGEYVLKQTSLDTNLDVGNVIPDYQDQGIF